MTALPQMTPAEHYCEAERLLDLVIRENDADNPWLAPNLAAAQVHATLATADILAIINVPDPEDARRAPTLDDLDDLERRVIGQWRDIHGRALVERIAHHYSLDELTAEAWFVNAARRSSTRGRR